MQVIGQLHCARKNCKSFFIGDLPRADAIKRWVYFSIAGPQANGVFSDQCINMNGLFYALFSSMAL